MGSDEDGPSCTLSRVEMDDELMVMEDVKKKKLNRNARSSRDVSQQAFQNWIEN